MFKREWFRYADLQDKTIKPDGESPALLNDLILFGTADLAVSAKKYADFSALGVWGYHPGQARLYLLAIEHGRMEAHQLLETMRTLVDRWNLSAMYVEKTAFTLQLCQLGISQGLPLKWLKADTDKVSRSMPATAMFESGRVYFVRQPKLIALENELLTFPTGKHDDLVDMTSYGVRVFLEVARWRAQQARWNSDGLAGGRLVVPGL